jgi:hypothetical protein
MKCLLCVQKGMVKNGKQRRQGQNGLPTRLTLIFKQQEKRYLDPDFKDFCTHTGKQFVWSHNPYKSSIFIFVVCATSIFLHVVEPDVSVELMTNMVVDLSSTRRSLTTLLISDKSAIVFIQTTRFQHKAAKKLNRARHVL